MNLKQWTAKFLGVAICSLGLATLAAAGAPDVPDAPDTPVAAASTAVSASAPETVTPCQFTGNFIPPRVEWMGKFAFKAQLSVKNGHLADVDVSPVRGADQSTNDTLDHALEDYVKQHCVCTGSDQVLSQYFVLNLKHSTPPEMAPFQARLTAAERMREQVAASAAARASAPSDFLVPFRPENSAQICTKMGKPDLPRVNAVGTVELSVLAEVKDSQIGLVDVKLVKGSSDMELNRKFIDSVTRAIRSTYQCAGNHIFQQAFVFNLRN